MITDTDVAATHRNTRLGLVPTEWGYPMLKDVSVKITDGAHTSPPSCDSKDSYPIYSVKNMTEIDFSRDEPRLIGKADYDSLVSQGCQPLVGDVLVSKDGSVLRYCFDLEEAFDGVLLSSIAIIRPDKDSMYPKYLVQYFKQGIVKSYVAKALTSGSGVPRIILKDFRSLRIALPPLPEQKKIATILGTWDKAIAKLEKLIAEKEDLKKGLMQQLLTGKKRFPGFTDEWRKIEIQEIGRVIRGSSPRPKGDPRYYGGNVPRLMVQDVTRDGKYVTPSIDFLTEEGAKKSRPCPAGTLTMVCSGDVGTPSFLAVDACIHDGFLAIVDLTDKVNEDYLFYQLIRMRDRMERSATHGGVFTNLKTTILKEFIIELPAIDEQVKIAEVLSTADEELKQLNTQLTMLKDQKKGLMQQLLTGKVRVKIEGECG